ncbi:Large subunit GTPase 1-like [Acipenser ruthenus]|uniref:Large subunit GTPase 1 homolog n=1 Tax=Acipenser ruthenus TaxID=7906 RepID=A0A444V5R4_ACIRT|nr:Large subunit GTPase 1-like [Acipenser ruthenus]
MGKKKSAAGGSTGLGRALIKERQLAGRSHKKTGSWLHTCELNDGYDWGRLNLQSVTEQNSLDEFLATAELAGTEFVAEKLNIKFVPAEARSGLLTAEESQRIKELHEENKHFLRIPRRLEEQQTLILTPFERNLDFWRQLWRVIERSDVVVQILDARNPLLFRSLDLECYVKEVSEEKENMLLLNKADLLTREQRRVWARHFEKEGVRAVFWSALAEGMRLDAEEKGEELEGITEEQSDREGEEDEDGDFENQSKRSRARLEKAEQSGSVAAGLEGSPAAPEEDEDIEAFEDCVEEGDWQTCSEDQDSEDSESTENMEEASSTARPYKKALRNSSRLLQKEELLEIFKAVHTGTRVKEGQITVGLVGYPNVGKSSTINTILRNKKVSVSATPGHTKHFQTLYVEPGLCLCDCPGLVMPSFVSTKAEMTCCGILPIDQMRDHHIPRHVLEATYGINIIRPREDEDPDRTPTAEEFLTAYGYMRGFMTAHGQPDQPRSARYILKDYVNGKLLYCHPPPHIKASDFQPQHDKKINDEEEQGATRTGKPLKVKRIENTVDKNFFHQASFSNNVENVRALTKGVQSVMGYKPGNMPAAPGASVESMAGKPWKKHGNRNKKEKCQKKPVHSSSSAFITIYSFLGNMCNTLGGSRKKLKKRRRNRNVFAVTLPLAVGSGYYISKNTFQSKPFENDFHRTGRRLLTTFLQGPDLIKFNSKKKCPRNKMSTEIFAILDPLLQASL